MTRPNLLPVPVLAEAIRRGTVGAREAVADALAQIEAQDGDLGAVVALDAESAMADAAAVDEAVARGTEDRPLAGVPTLVKDLNNARGLPTTFGARSMADFVAPFDDHAVANLRASGMVVLGKTAAPEVGSLPVTESVLHGATRNPWDHDRTPGGSSGGAAVAVAAGYVAAAHGSDGGGSLRIPASCCGVVGLKPSRGRVSQGPLFGDQVMGYATQGPIGRHVADVAALLDAMQGYAPGDPYHLDPPSRPWVEEAATPPDRPLRVGLLEQVPWAIPDPAVASALEVAVTLLTDLGHEVAPLDVRLGGDVIDRFVTVWAASVAANPLPEDQLEPHNQGFAEAGRATSAPDLLRAFAGLQVTARAFVRACGAHDVVLAPVLMQPPLPIGALQGLGHDALVSVLARHLGISPVVNVTGQPAITLPVHVDTDGLPVGVQLIGPAAGEGVLLRLAAQVEIASGWARRGPAWR